MQVSNLLHSEDSSVIKPMMHAYRTREKDMITPLWSEGIDWNDVNDAIHRSLFNNEKVKRYTPAK